MKNFLIKALLATFLCSTAVNSMQAAIGKKEAAGILTGCFVGGLGTYKLLESFKFINVGSKSDLHYVIHSKCEDRNLAVTVENARFLFESKDAQKYIPKHYFLFTSINFIQEFTDYAREIKNTGGEGFETNLKVYHMAQTYLDYLKRPLITKKNGAAACLGAGATALACSKQNGYLMPTAVAVATTAIFTHFYGNIIVDKCKQLGSNIFRGIKQFRSKLSAKRAKQFRGNRRERSITF